MRLLHLLERRQQFSRQLRIVTVAFKFVDDLSLTPDVSLTLRDVRAGLLQMLQEDAAIHLLNIARSCRAVRVRPAIIRFSARNPRAQSFAYGFSAALSWDHTRLSRTCAEEIIGRIERFI